MIKTSVVCDVCRGESTSATAVCGGKVHVCVDCNKGPVHELVRAVLANAPSTCRCVQSQWQQAIAGQRWNGQ